MLYRFKEHVATALAAQPDALTGKEWDVVLIEAGFSLNRGESGRPRYYPAEALRDAVPLFEGLKANIFLFGDRLDHLPDAALTRMPEGYAANQVGFYHKVRFAAFTRPDGTKGEGIIGKLHILEGCDWLRRNMLDAWKQGQSKLYQFSIDADGESQLGVMEGKDAEIITRIVAADSTDVVSKGAAGGSILRLAASGRVVEATALGDFITAEADRKNITDEQLASGAGISVSTMQQIKRGEIVRPPDNRIRGIARVLGTSFDRLLNLIPEDLRESAPDGAFNMDKLLALLKTHRARWLEGYKETDGQSQSDFLMGIFQGNPGKAKDVLATTALSESDKTQDVARGVEALGKVVTLLKEGKVDDATAILEGWLPKHAALSEGEAPALALSDYGIPAAAPAAPAAAAAGTVDPAAAPAAAPAAVGVKESVPSIEVRLAAIEKRERLLECRHQLAGSKLPDNAQARCLTVMESLVGQDDYMAKLQLTITSEREYIASLRESGAVVGLGHGHGGEGGRVSVGADEQAKFGQAMDGYFNNNGKNVGGVKRFYSIHEAYVQIMKPREHLSRKALADRILLCMGQAVANRSADETEDHITALKESWSSFVSKRILESIGVPDFAVAFGDAMFRRMQRETTDANRNDWQDLVTSRESNQDLDNPVKIFRTGGIQVMPVVAAKGVYQELDPVTPTEESTDLILEKRGGTVEVTWEAVLADQNRVIRSIPVKLGRSAAKTVQKAAFDPMELNENTQDGNPLIVAGHNNLVAGALTYATLVTAVLTMRNQTELDSGDKLGLTPAILWVPTELEATAVEILESLVKITANEDATVRSFVNKLGIKPRVSVSLGRTGATQVRAWLTAEIGDSEGIAIGFLNGKETPDLFVQGPNETPTSGAAFSSDILTFKARMPVEAVAVDHRWVVGINF